MNKIKFALVVLIVVLAVGYVYAQNEENPLCGDIVIPTVVQNIMDFAREDSSASATDWDQNVEGFTVHDFERCQIIGLFPGDKNTDNMALREFTSPTLLTVTELESDSSFISVPKLGDVPIKILENQMFWLTNQNNEIELYWFYISPGREWQILMWVSHPEDPTQSYWRWENLNFASLNNLVTIDYEWHENSQGNWWLIVSRIR